MPTDPHNIECAQRFREGAIGNLGMVKSFYYGGLFGDPPLTKTIESRLRSLVWVNDVAIGGSYHVNACIHPIQAMMWVLGKTPVAAAGISRIARAESARRQPRHVRDHLRVRRRTDLDPHAAATPTATRAPTIRWPPASFSATPT